MKREVAIVVVSKEWIDTPGINEMINRGRPSGSTGDTHIVTAPLHNSADPRGLWLSRIVTANGVEMRFMIPWDEVLGLGIVEDEDTRPARSIGFSREALTSFVPGSSGEPNG